MRATGLDAAFFCTGNPVVVYLTPELNEFGPKRPSLALFKPLEIPEVFLGCGLGIVGAIF